MLRARRARVWVCLCRQEWNAKLLIASYAPSASVWHYYAIDQTSVCVTQNEIDSFREGETDGDFRQFDTQYIHLVFVYVNASSDSIYHKVQMLSCIDHIGTHVQTRSEEQKEIKSHCRSIQHMYTRARSLTPHPNEWNILRTRLFRLLEDKITFLLLFCRRRIVCISRSSATT